MLDEPDILALLAETLAADVEAVFADQAGLVEADAARLGFLVSTLLCVGYFIGGLMMVF